MPNDDLQYANQFAAIAPYYDEVMRPVPYRMWVQYLRKLIKRFGWAPVRVLDLACGTGTVALMLAREGYRVTGVDLSEPMLQVARAKARDEGLAHVEFQQQDATQLALPPEFDLVVSLFDSLNYILTAKGLQDAFAGVFRCLQPGGGFIFDLNGEYALAHNLFSQDNMDEPDAEVKHQWTARYNPRTRIATVDMQFFLPNGKTFREVHKQRAHRHADVVRFLREAGFEYLDAFDAYSFLPAGRNSDRIFYVARRP